MAILLDKQKQQRYAQARRARDARFDGLFFTAVKTTGIYCRAICPATAPLEKNVEYHDSAISAAQAGFRPCLRCRPDSAPQSYAWLGAETTFNRAFKLIQQGALQQGSLPALATRLGVSDRYLRQLFAKYLGISPKKYAIYQQCLFAKQLLHQTTLRITDIAYASGFNSVRRFNEAMQQQIGLTPGKIRKSDQLVSGSLTLKLYYRPPYAWKEMLSFLQNRTIEGLEWADESSYSRTIEYKTTQGYFSATANPEQHCFDVTLYLNEYQNLNPIIQHIRAIFDLDASIDRIDQQLQTEVGDHINYLSGLRVPGIWSTFEAGVRAILGQQVSVTAARNLVQTLVNELGQTIELGNASAQFLFPLPEAIVDNELRFFRMPQSRKDTLRRLAKYMLMSGESDDDIDQWLEIKGIGPWTVNYVKLRAARDPDVWLAGDAGIKNALKKIDTEPDLDTARPWRSYLTVQLWNQL